MDIEAIVAKYAGDIRLFGDVMRAALTELAAGYEEQLADSRERIHQLEAERDAEYTKGNAAVQKWAKRALEAERVPKGFLSDVMTAAGLVGHGKRDKGLSERLRISVQAMLTYAPSAPATVVTEATGKYGLQLESERVPEDSRLEFALEQLVNVCNNHNDACNWSETISAEAALEKLYKRRLAAAPQPKKEWE